MDAVEDGADQWALLETLSEPKRRAVYEAVGAADEPRTRDEVAQATGISRALAAFHLDKLVEAGLLEASTRAPVGRRKAKIGRPAKRYRRSARQVELTMPPRQYALAGQILAAALDATSRGQPAVPAAARIAYDRGYELTASDAQRPLAEPVESLARACQALEAFGYAPAAQQGRVTMSNCPFHAIVRVAQQLTCQMNLALIDGVLAGVGAREQVTPVLDPQPGRCCVVLRAGSEDQVSLERRQPAD